MMNMEVKELHQIIESEDKDGTIGQKDYWQELWSYFVEESGADYHGMEVKDALPRLISELNYRKRRRLSNCTEIGVNIRKGDICFIDYGSAYVNEIGYQHFGLIITIFHNKAFVVPMSGNSGAYRHAYCKENPKGKRHLMRLGKIKGMNKESVLFINDAKWINTARIIDVKAHLDHQSELFMEIKERVKKCLD